MVVVTYPLLPTIDVVYGGLEKPKKDASDCLVIVLLPLDLTVAAEMSKF